MVSSDPLEAIRGLTDEELALLRLRCKGLSNIEIGEKLYWEEPTVKDKMRLLYAQLGLRGRSNRQIDRELHRKYCPALEEYDRLRRGQTSVDEPTQSEEIVEGYFVAEEDERLEPTPEPQRRRWMWLVLLIVGIVVGAILACGALYLLGFMGPDDRPGAPQISPEAVRETVEVAVAQTVEVTREVPQIITATPAPPGPTATPIIHTQVVEVIITATPEPSPTPTPISESADETTEQPIEETMPPEAPSSFALPFVDSFDGSLRSEWEILSGDVYFGNGRLSASTEEVTLSIGDTLTDYEVSFDYWNVNLSSDYLVLGVAPKLRYVQFRHVWRWYEFEDTEWVEIVYEPTGIPASGHMTIRREGNTITVLVNGQLHYEYTHNDTLEAGPFVITFADDTQIDNFTIAAP